MPVVPLVDPVVLGVDVAVPQVLVVVLRIGAGVAQVGALALQLAIVAVLLEAVRRRHVPAAFNAVLALGVALLPAFGSLLSTLGTIGDVSYGPALPLWLGVAGFLHAFGMLGAYDQVWWWDHLTHTVSASLLAALVYAGLIVAAAHSSGAWIPDGGVWAVTLALVFVVGVLWELIELGARLLAEYLELEPMLVHYGRYDTVLDLGFDLVGALLVVTFDIRVFVGLAAPFPELTGSLVLAFGGVSVVGSVLLGLVVARGGSDERRFAP